MIRIAAICAAASWSAAGSWMPASNVGACTVPANSTRLVEDDRQHSERAGRVRTAEDACLPVAEDVDLDDTFDVHLLPAGHIATTTHVGPLDDLALVVNAVMGWIAGNGHRVGSPFRIQLLSLPPLFTTPSAGGTEPVTKVFVPFN